MAEILDTTSQPMTFDGSLSFLDDLMALESIGTAELSSLISSSFAEAPGEGYQQQKLTHLGRSASFYSAT